MVRCLGRGFIAAFGLPVLLLPFPPLERRLEVVGELAPLVGRQVVQQRHQFGMCEALGPEARPHLRPVLRLTLRVVVLAAGPAAASRFGRFKSRRAALR